MDTDLGEVHISPPRERTGEFELKLLANGPDNWAED
ncbi:MAG: hypothetical protein IPF67_14065 [Saprospiraceae bacterium]|nr:hypothetical protein [Candidatus Brachybacter algidus]